MFCNPFGVNSTRFSFSGAHLDLLKLKQHLPGSCDADFGIAPAFRVFGFRVFKAE